MSAFRHHSSLGVYEDRNGKTCRVRYIPQLMVELQGEHDEFVFQSDMVQVLSIELPTHDTSRSTLTFLETKESFILGREIKDDGYIRTIEVEKA